MDIISSLSTLSFDKEEVNFYERTNNITQVIDKKVIKRNFIWFLGWRIWKFSIYARTINNYAIDYNKNKIIELKKTEDSFASAANYLKKIGWKKNAPCFYKIELNQNIPKKYLNSSARNINNKKKVFFFKKYIKNFDTLHINDNISSAIITPDKDIIPGSQTLSPAYLVFDNYEKILQWNRSLRFALAFVHYKITL